MKQSDYVEMIENLCTLELMNKAHKQQALRFVETNYTPIGFDVAFANFLVENPQVVNIQEHKKLSDLIASMKEKKND